jgi:glycosyltransferase involved in cell wall biosynthesis
MLDITTVILTYNEELHIARCLENVCTFSRKVIIVDSCSTDRTREIVEGFNQQYHIIEFVEHKYPGNQAEQFNWAIDNLKIDTEWVLRIDADEYLLPELVEELKQKLPDMPKDVTGLEFKRRHIFMGKWVKHGIYPVIIMRMFRTGYGRYDARLMDEHITLREGRSVVFDHDFCEHSLSNISEYCKKHINYAQREATEILKEVYCLTEDVSGNVSHLGEQAEGKHRTKSRYNRLPLFWRSFAYFIYRYILRGGVLDGKEGFVFSFIQGWWYRTLVDTKILEVGKWLKSNNLNANSPEGRQALKTYIKDNWGIVLNN